MADTKTDTNSSKVINTENAFSVRCKVFLEGVEIPYTSVSVSYGLNGTPSCTISLQGANLLRTLPENTKILIIYQNPDDDYLTADWYVLFDGELASFSYNLNSSGAQVYISGIHATETLNLAQLLLQDNICAVSSCSNPYFSGGATSIFNQGNGNVVEGLLHKTLIDSVKDKTGLISAAADFIYLLIMAIFDPKRVDLGLGSIYDTSANKYYRDKITVCYKLQDRIVGVGSAIKNGIESIMGAIRSKDPNL